MTRRLKVKEQEYIASQSKQNPKIFWSYINSKRQIGSKIGDVKIVNKQGERRILTEDNGKKLKPLMNIFQVFLKKISRF